IRTLWTTMAGASLRERSTNSLSEESLKATIADVMDTMVVLTYEEFPAFETSSVP
ncbi:hypothetical protein TNCV_3062671, partial [Trichonephila clavipes]